jgi:aminoglycoside 6'-N-acetyltransferase I
MNSAVLIRLLGESDAALLQACADDVFDNAISRELAAEFLGDARHHIVAAIADGTLIGFASAVHYVHPDKASEMWINEVGVAESHRGQGIGKRLLAAMLSHGRILGCTEAWVVTEVENATAQRLYASVGGASRNVVYFTFPLNDSQ